MEQPQTRFIESTAPGLGSARSMTEVHVMNSVVIAMVVFVGAGLIAMAIDRKSVV